MGVNKIDIRDDHEAWQEPPRVEFMSVAGKALRGCADGGNLQHWPLLRTHYHIASKISCHIYYSITGRE